jgi:hypothetical protein
MAGPAFVGCWAKWERGKRHLQSVHDQIDVAIGPEPRRVIPFQAHLESQTGLKEVWVWNTPPDFPDIATTDIATTIGDTLSCFRGAMDHLAWLAVKRQGTPLKRLKRRQLRRIAFPLAARWATYQQAFRDALPGINLASEFGRLVKSYQPCGRANRAKAMRALRNLSDRDKHRLLIPTFWFPEHMKFNLTSDGLSLVGQELLVDVSKRLRVKPDQPIMRTTVVPISLRERHLNLEADVSFQPALGGGWWMAPTLAGIRDEVAGLLTLAERLL